MESKSIYWDKTTENTYKVLCEKMRPMSYRHLYEETVVFTESGSYSEKTKPVEKFRQHFSDHKLDRFVYLSGGHIALKQWFPRDESNAPRMFCTNQMITIDGDCTVAYHAGYEQARREPFMKDHYKDANTALRKFKRLTGKLAEAHVQKFFAINYPEFYREPTNHNKYEMPSKDDFQLQINKNMLAVDVKQTSYTNESGHDIAFARNPKDGVIFIIADWNDNNTTTMSGMAGCSWLKTVGLSVNKNIHMPVAYTWNVECLLVYLNMMKIGKNKYASYAKEALRKGCAIG